MIFHRNWCIGPIALWYRKLLNSMPNIWYICAICVHVGCAYTCGSDSPKHEDDPQYPNLENIRDIRRCSSPRSWMIFLFEEKMNLLTFFLFKEKNYRTLRLATAPYIANILKIWVLGIISILRRVRSTRVDILYLHTEGTEISTIRHRNRKFLCQKCATWVRILRGAHHLKVQRISFRMSPIAFSNSSWLFF